MIKIKFLVSDQDPQVLTNLITTVLVITTSKPNHSVIIPDNLPIFKINNLETVIT